MSQIHLSESHVAVFRKAVQDCILATFGMETELADTVSLLERLEVNADYLFVIPYTGMAFGEYLFSCSSALMLSLIGVPPEDAGEEELQDAVDAMCELLNISVGKCIEHLEDSHRKLTYASPRILQGGAKFPPIPTGKVEIKIGDNLLTCYFYIDMMKLDLAVSYEEAISKLTYSKKELEKALHALKNNQAQLIQSEKMASLGQIAAGIAHEINNPSGFVLSNIDTMEEYLRVIRSLLSLYDSLAQTLDFGDKKVSDNLNEVKRIREKEDFDFIISDLDGIIRESREGMSRIKEIVMNLKTFARADGGGYELADLNEGIQSTLKLANNELKYKCEVHLKLGKVPKFYCNIGQINQVILNMLVNSAQAIPEKGEVMISSGVQDKMAVVKISDTGTGIPEDKIKEIFSPFYTSKPVGKGTGLGLSISHGIIQKHGGKIEVRSKVGKGTVFTVSIPLRLSPPENDETKGKGEED